MKKNFLFWQDWNKFFFLSFLTHILMAIYSQSQIIGKVEIFYFLTLVWASQGGEEFWERYSRFKKFYSISELLLKTATLFRGWMLNSGIVLNKFQYFLYIGENLKSVVDIIIKQKYLFIIYLCIDHYKLAFLQCSVIRDYILSEI